MELNNLYKNIYEEIESYCRTYNNYEKSKKIYDSIARGNFPKFVVLTRELLDHARDHLKEGYTSDDCSNICEVIAWLTEYVQSWDFMIEFLIGKKKISDQVEFFSIVKTVGILPFEILDKLKNLPFDATSKIIYRFKNLFLLTKKEAEINQLKNTVSDFKKELLTISELRNNDFFLYLDLIYPVFKEDCITYLKNFFHYYTLIDLILDDFTDLPLDLKKGSFNSLIWYNDIKFNPIECEDYSEVQRVFIDNGIYDYFYDLVMELSKKASKGLGNYSSDLASFLKYLLAGEIEGIKLFKRLSYLQDLIQSPMLHEKLTLLLLKPYPWAVYSWDHLNTNFAHQIIENKTTK